MPVVFSVGSSQVWNLEASVGLASPNRFGDVLLVQYLLFWMNIRVTNVANQYLIGEVDGIWGPRSQKALNRLQSGSPEVFVSDGFASVMSQELTGFQQQVIYS